MTTRPQSSDAQPSLLAVATFLVERFAAGLAEERCQACGAHVLPDDPALTHASPLVRLALTT